MRIKAFLSAAAFAAFSMQSSFAAISTTNTKSTATIAATCQISATNMSFGQIGTTPGGYTTASSTVTVLCSKNASYNIQAGSGSTNPSWSVQTLSLYMLGPVGGLSNYMQYTLCIDASTPVANIGVGSYGTTQVNTKCNGYVAGLNTLLDYIKSKGTGDYQTLNLNGAVQNGYNYNTGSYSDTNTLTVTF